MCDYVLGHTLTICCFWNVGGHDSPPPHQKGPRGSSPAKKPQLLPLLMVVHHDLTLRHTTEDAVHFVLDT